MCINVNNVFAEFFYKNAFHKNAKSYNINVQLTILTNIRGIFQMIPTVNFPWFLDLEQFKLSCKNELSSSFPTGYLYEPSQNKWK